MPNNDLDKLAYALNEFAKLYQFRSLEKRLYGALTVSQSYCLRTLYFQGDKTMSELSADLGVRLSTMTGIIDQLEYKRLVERVDHPEDRRSLRVRLTPRGKEVYGAAHEAFLGYLKPVFDRQTAAGRENILRFVADVTGAVRRWQDNPNRKVRRRAKKNS